MTTSNASDLPITLPVEIFSPLGLLMKLKSQIFLENLLELTFSHLSSSTTLTHISQENSSPWGGFRLSKERNLYLSYFGLEPPFQDSIHEAFEQLGVSLCAIIDTILYYSLTQAKISKLFSSVDNKLAELLMNVISTKMPTWKAHRLSKLPSIAPNVTSISTKIALISSSKSEIEDSSLQKPMLFLELGLSDDTTHSYSMNYKSLSVLLDKLNILREQIEKIP